MKIAFLNKYQNSVSRGAETYVTELSKRLSKRHNVEVISNINYWKIFNSHFDLIIPTNGREQVFLIRLITWLRGSKMIVSGQSGCGLDDRLNLYAFPDLFIPLSSFALSWAKKINPLVKSVCIPNGADLIKFNPNRIANKITRPKTVLAVGAFVKNKRHDLTIKAVSKLKNVRLVIAGGGGDLKEKIQKLANTLLGKDRFEIVTVTNDKMPKIYQKCDMLAFPTVPWESFGIVLVEAMASNLPVIANNDPIRKEIVGDAGFLVDPNDTTEYAKILEKALNTNWENKPRKQAEKFDWDIIAKKYEEELLKL